MIQIALASSQQSTFHRFHFPLLSVLTTDGSSYIRRSTIPSISTAPGRTTKQGSETTTFGSDSRRCTSWHRVPPYTNWGSKFKPAWTVSGIGRSSARFESTANLEDMPCTRCTHLELPGMLWNPPQAQRDRSKMEWNSPHGMWITTWIPLTAPRWKAVEIGSTSAMVRCAFWSPGLDRITNIAVCCIFRAEFTYLHHAWWWEFESEQMSMWTYVHNEIAVTEPSYGVCWGSTHSMYVESRISKNLPKSESVSSGPTTLYTSYSLLHFVLRIHYCTSYFVFIIALRTSYSLLHKQVTQVKIFRISTHSHL